MANLMTSLSVGVSGLNVSQNGIHTTSHNLANVDTNGYVRQQVLINDFKYTTIGQSAQSLMQVGLGAATEAVRQVRNVFLDQQIRRELGRQGFYDSQLEVVYEIEDIFGETEGERFQLSMQDIWDSVQELIKTPNDKAARTNFVKKVEVFLERAETMANQMATYQIGINQQIIDKVDRINELGNQIYELNHKIKKNEGSGVENANDYRDARNNCLDELSQLINITYKEDVNGVVTVMAEGVSFVSEDMVTKMGVETMAPDYDKVMELSNIVAEYNRRIAADPSQAAVLEAERQGILDELGKYIAFTENEPGGSGSGTLILTTDFGEIVNGNKTNANVAKKICSTSPMVKPIWPSLSTDVFNFDKLPSGENNTNIGSLKGLVLVRGSEQANYTSIPKRENYTSDKEFDKAVEEYNIAVDSSMIMKIQAEFDQLIHAMVVGINDIFAPNKEIELADGTKIMIFDEENAPAGIDGDPTAGELPTKGEALFNRKGIERYTDRDVTVFALDANGNKIANPLDPSGTGFKTETIKVREYNQEDPLVDYTLFTLGEIEVNQEILQDYSKLPLSSGDGTGEESREVAEKLNDLWNTKFSSVNPNVLTQNTFKDYYIAMTGEFANRANTIQGIAEYQETLVSEIDGKRMNVTGVSSDEELTNLIRFQHAYNASSRYINVISEMLEHIVTRL